MDPIGPAIQSSLAGVSQAQRKATAEQAARERAETRPRRAGDRAEFTDALIPTEAVEAVRPLESNDQEEAHEDRLAHDHDRAEEASRRRRLDLEG